MSAVFARDLTQKYPTISHGKGVYLYDTDGKRYLDGCAGALVANIGHGVEEVAEAMAEQARRVAYTHLSTFMTAPAIQLAEQIRERSPQGLDSVYYASGGSEAVDTALKLARSYFVERDGPSASKYLIIGRWRLQNSREWWCSKATGVLLFAT